jgi:hypothetical protein
MAPPATVRVWDRLYDPSGKPLNGRLITVALQLDATTINPITQVPGGQLLYSAVTGPDPNDATMSGYWQVDVVPTDTGFAQAGNLYTVMDGFRDYQINPVSAGIPGIGWQSSAIRVNTPPGSSAVGVQLPDGTTATGSLIIKGPDPWLDPGPPSGGDDTANLIAALASGKPIRLGPYTFSVAPDQLKPAQWRGKFRGTGLGQTILKARSAGTAVLTPKTTTGNDGYNDDQEIGGFTIDCDGLATNGVLIANNTARYNRWDNIEIRGAAGDGWLTQGRCFSARMLSIIVRNCTGFGFNFQRFGCQDTALYSCKSINNTLGQLAVGNGTDSVVGLSFFGFFAQALVGQPSQNADTIILDGFQDLVFDNCYAEALIAGRNIFRIKNSGALTNRQLTLRGQWFQPNAAADYCISIDNGAPITGLIIDAGEVATNPGLGFINDVSGNSVIEERAAYEGAARGLVSRYTNFGPRLKGAAQAVGAGEVGLGGQTANGANAGAQAAPPATVDGYLLINVGGTVKKVPYYAN